MLMIAARGFSGCRSGHHGASEFKTSTTSASCSHGPGSAPTWHSCSVDIASDVAHQVQTGMPHARTISENASKLRSSPAPRWAIIKGRFEFANKSAAASISLGTGADKAGLN